MVGSGGAWRGVGLERLLDDEFRTTRAIAVDKESKDGQWSYASLVVTRMEKKKQKRNRLPVGNRVYRDARAGSGDDDVSALVVATAGPQSPVRALSQWLGPSGSWG
jgi:hypothetical protein